MRKTEKVSQIEFHIKSTEFEDFTLRAAALIEEGYKYVCIKQDPLSISYFEEPEPPYHILMQKTGE